MALEEIKPPQSINSRHYKDSLKIFLAGTIDMGSSEDWQAKAIEYLSRQTPDGSSAHFNKNKRVTVFNPRRDDWDNSWKQSIEAPNFYQQVNWELNALEKSDIIVVNILEDSKSPITLLEIGLHANSAKIKICCPKNFYRRGNIEIVCDRYDIPLYENINHLLGSIS